MVTPENNIRNDIEKNSIQYDPYRLAELARLAIGTRSISDFCEQTQLSKSFVSRILNAKLSAPPARRTLCRFAGPQATPENNISLKDMLMAAGYSTTIDEPTLSESTLAGEENESELTNMVQMHFSKSPTFGLSVFLNALMANEYGEAYSIEFQPSVFSLKIRDFDYKIICIPAFCNSESAIKTVQVSVLTTLIMSMSNYAADKSIFFVMTNNGQLYNELISTLAVVPKMKLAVLLTNEDGDGFSKQDVVSSKNSCLDNNDIEDFPILFC